MTALLRHVEAILQQHDATVFGRSRPSDAYRAEAGRVVLRLTRTCPESVTEVEAILREVLSVPSSDPRRLERDLADAAAQLHAEWSQRSDDTPTAQTGGREPSRAADRAAPTGRPHPTRGPTVAGARYRCTREAEATAMLVFSMPGTASQVCRIPEHTIVQVEPAESDRPSAIACRPIDADDFAARALRRDEFAHTRFSHFYLVVPAEVFLECFERLTTRA